ncbi:MAG: hypothetical protein ACRCUS_01320 [Anaerovoracaceae bacterium]
MNNIDTDIAVKVSPKTTETFSKANKANDSNNDQGLRELNQLLHNQLSKLCAEDIKEYELDKEIKRSKAVVSVAKTIINNNNTALNAQKHAAEYSSILPKMLE